MIATKRLNSKIGPGNKWPPKAAGMTLIEVLIAILLFAVFSGIFLTVTELMTSVMASYEAPEGASECSGFGEDRACIELYFDELVKILESSAFPGNVASSDCDLSPTALLSKVLNEKEVNHLNGYIWPANYEICFNAYSDLTENANANALQPGLYLLQAQPKPSTPLNSALKPVQRVFCRPSYLCS